MKAIIMAGGFGTRLMPLTKKIPKPMVPIIDKPILECIIELLRDYNVTDIGVTLGYMPNVITDYFKDGKAFGVNLTYFIEKTPLGTAGGVKNAESMLDDAFIVMSGDAFTNIDVEAMYRSHILSGMDITIACKDVDDVKGYGIVECNDRNIITKFREKPEIADCRTVNTGIYIINPGVLKMIPYRKYDFARDLFPGLIGRMNCYKTDRYWSDIGTLSSYYLTNEEVARNPQNYNFSLI